MNSSEAHRMMKEATQNLVDALNAGQSEQLRCYLAAMGRFSNYSVGNLILIMLQRPCATHVAGYQTWQSLGRQVNKGEKGISIIAPVVVRSRCSRQGGQHQRGQSSHKEEPHLVAFRGATVFDISQTQGKALPEFARVSGDPSQHTRRLRDFVANQGIVIEYSNRLGLALGASCGKKILVRPDLDPAEEVAVILHELAHELLHQGGDTPRSKTVRETEAEAVAFVVGTAMNLDCIQASSDYIRLYDGNADTLMKSLERIQKTARSIIQAVVEEPTASSRRQTDVSGPDALAEAA